ncbi:MAG: S8 family serine peptidase [Holophagales bacterium]|jgi:thermitase|nr:S8 family serine peptidase [Holophagales bacterium]
MNQSQTKKRFYVMASALALGLFGVIGCGTASQDNGTGNGPVSSNPPAPSAVSAPPVKYNFYEVTTEKALKEDTHYGYLIAKARPGFKESAFKKFGMEVVGRIIANGAIYYRLLAEDGKVLRAYKDAKKIGGLMYVEPELKITHCDTTPPFECNDPLAQGGLWGMRAIKAVDAWRTYGFGPNRPVVAAIDTGVSYNHEDLYSVTRHAYTWYDNNEPNNNHPDVDMTNLQNNLVLPDVKALAPTYVPGTDLFGHGTHTAGTICAQGNNGVGVAGVCWNVDLISYAGLDRGGSGNDWTMYGSLWNMANWKTLNNYTATIPVNASFSSLTASQFAIDMVEYALARGVMLVASSGNYSMRINVYPAAYSGVMAVGASDGADARASFSCWGRHVSVVAPGQGVISTSNASIASYEGMSGTSMAAPHVTGLIGYMLTFNPNLKPDQIKTYIEANADYINGQTGFSEETGWGRINALKTIEAVIADVNANRTPPSNYVISPVEVKVSFGDMIVHLYQCDAQGSILNYVSSAVSVETTYTGDTREYCSATFNLLRPGYYIATTSVAADMAGKTDVFEVKAGETVPVQEIMFDRQMLTVQTMDTMIIDFMTTGSTDEMCDTEITVFDSHGNVVFYYDWYLCDELTFIEPGEPGDYYIWINEYNGDYTAAAREYALWFGPNGRCPFAIDTGYSWTGGPVIYLAPGTYANPLQGVHSPQYAAMGAAQAGPYTDYNKLYYARFNGDAADGGTSGAAGHYYKFAVAESEE